MNKRQKKKLKNRDGVFHYGWSHWGWNKIKHVRYQVYAVAYLETMIFKMKPTSSDGDSLCFSIRPSNFKRSGRYILRPHNPIRKTSKAFSDRIRELNNEYYLLMAIYKDNLILDYLDKKFDNFRR